MTPKRRMLSRIHAVAASLAFLIILSFTAASIWAELTGEPDLIASVKGAIAWCLLLLVPALAATGGTGVAIAGLKPKGRVAVKMRRMRVIAANGLLVLVPAALFLAWKAGRGEFDGWFAAVQAVEFAAGAVNIALMGLNVRDGLAITGRIGRKPRHSAVSAPR